MFLTKLIGGLLMPLSIVILILLLGLLLTMRRRWLAVGRGVLAVGIVLLLLVSTPWLPERLLLPLEVAFEPPTQDAVASAQWVAVLGGGCLQPTSSEAAPVLSRASLARLTAGVEWLQSLPDARLVMSGGSKGCSMAELMARQARQWGVAEERMVILPEPRTTAEEAQALGDLVPQGETVLLVSSAFHLQRAVNLLQSQGIHVLPGPADFLVDARRSESHVGALLPRARYVQMSEHAVWERLGLLWALLRGEARAAVSIATSSAP